MLSTTSINDKKALQGWRLADLQNYLETELSRVADANGDITSHTTLWETIKAIPKLRLTDIETTTIAAAFNRLCATLDLDLHDHSFTFLLATTFQS